MCNFLLLESGKMMKNQCKSKIITSSSFIYRKSSQSNNLKLSLNKYLLIVLLFLFHTQHTLSFHRIILQTYPLYQQNQLIRNNLLLHSLSNNKETFPLLPIDPYTDPSINPIITVPNHIAFIVDGNGRWAIQKKLNRIEGHKAGALKTVEIVKYCFERGVNTITLYLFSTENWKRPPLEIQNIMFLLQQYLTNMSDYLIENNIRVEVIGQRDRLQESVITAVSTIENIRSLRFGKHSTYTLCLALSYGGRDEIIQACKAIVNDMQSGKIDSINNITESLFSQYTFTGSSKIPDPDLIIRTSGEKRLSNFLLWQSAYSEFTEISSLWPDLTKEEIDSAIKNYCTRERRFGGLAILPATS